MLSSPPPPRCTRDSETILEKVLVQRAGDEALSLVARQLGYIAIVVVGFIGLKMPCVSPEPESWERLLLNPDLLRWLQRVAASWLKRFVDGKVGWCTSVVGSRLKVAPSY
jgi:hypothetical protein